MNDAHTVSFIWSMGNTPWEQAYLPGVSEADYAEELLFALDDKPAIYVAWAAEHFESDAPSKAVRQIYDHAPLTEAIIKRLNPDRNTMEFIADAHEIGYPLS